MPQLCHQNLMGTWRKHVLPWRGRLLNSKLLLLQDHQRWYQSGFLLHSLFLLHLLIFFFAFISSKFKQLTGSSNQKFENFHFYFVFKIQIKLLELILYLTGSFIWPLSLLPIITALIIWHKVITEKRKSRLCLSYPWHFSGVFLVTNLS